MASSKVYAEMQEKKLMKLDVGKMKTKELVSGKKAVHLHQF